MSLAMTAAGHRRQAGRREIIAHVDYLMDLSAKAQHEAWEMMTAITRRSEQNHIAEGISLAFSERRTRDE